MGQLHLLWWQTGTACYWRTFPLLGALGGCYYATLGPSLPPPHVKPSGKPFVSFGSCPALRLSKRLVRSTGCAMRCHAGETEGVPGGIARLLLIRCGSRKFPPNIPGWISCCYLEIPLTNCPRLSHYFDRVRFGDGIARTRSDF